MSSPFRPIIGTLGYVISPCGQKVLLIHRNTRPGDLHLGKYNGLGGKLERNEDVVYGMCREIYEESGLACRSLCLAGTISWPGFGKQGEDWFGFVFRILSTEGNIKGSSPEGTLEWIPVAQIMELPLWDGDRYFLPLVFDPDGPVFHGVLPYKDGKPVSWSVSLGGARSVFSAPKFEFGPL